MAITTRDPEAPAVAPLPRRYVYIRLSDGLTHGHTGWLFRPEEMARDGIGADALRNALGSGWTVRAEEPDEIIVQRWDDAAHARADIERAFPERSR